MDKEKLLVEAICNGTVLDHIPSDKLFAIVALLHLEEMSTPLTIANNLESKHFGSKGIIKMSDRFFSDGELNRIAILAPEVRLNVIQNYDVVEKKTLTPPTQVVGIVRCPNPKCITNSEPMPTKFLVHHTTHSILEIECYYCGRKVSSNQIELL